MILSAAHFDVQPVDPLNLWDQPPFEASLKDGYFHGRGVDDDKGGLLLPIQVQTGTFDRPPGQKFAQTTAS